MKVLVLWRASGEGSRVVGLGRKEGGRERALTEDGKRTMKPCVSAREANLEPSKYICAVPVQTAGHYVRPREKVWRGER